MADGGSIEIGERGTRQDYGTPPEFIAAIERRFGPLDYDLAAHARNHVAPLYLDAVDDALSRDWSELEGLAFLNPPFQDIAPWAERCARYASSRLRIVALWPAAIDALWFEEHVRKNAVSYGISRLQFVGATASYPKPLMISVFGMSVTGLGQLWRWRR